MTANLRAALADRYRIERELGQGGMATVYLAHDLKHDRQVAIKVLRPELAAVIGAERFLSEIRTTANLQHPHILPLFDSGATPLGRPERSEESGRIGSEFLFYVMPYVDGESLRDRLTRDKQLPLADAVRIAREVADALDYAHRKGIVHRDIKPENILLHDGRALVADFGIALAASRAGESRMTQTGMSLGTPAYMSPEQAMGERDIGPKSDIYALGAMTYEMLVGDPPFTGSTVQAIVAKAMTEKPIPPTRIRDTVPPAVEHAVLTALQKLPADRFASAKEFGDALVQPAPAAISQSGTVALPTTTRARTRSPAMAGMALLSVLSLLVAAWSLTRPGGAAGAAPAVYDAALPDSAPMLFAATTATRSYGAPLRGISVAPTGEFVIYSARQGDSTALWRRSLRDAAATPILGTTGATGPRISPDGKQVAFLVGDRVMVVPIGGGEPRLLLEGQAVATLEWSSPTTLLTTTLDGYRMVWLDPQVGQTRVKDIAARCLFGRWIPEQRRLMCRLNGRAVVVDPESGEDWVVHVTAPDGSDGPPLTGSGFVVLGGDMLVYLSVDGDLRAAPYDAVRQRIGRPATLSTAVRGEALGDVQLDVTPDGTLVYAPGTNAELGQLVRLRPGTPPEPLVAERAAFQRFDLSPDQRFLAAVVQTSEDQELRIYDLRDRQRTVWLHAQDVRHPLWSPAADRLLVATVTGTRGSLLVGMPGSGRAPDTLFAADSVNFLRDPIDFVGAQDLVVADWVNGVVLRADPTATPVRFDSVLTEARFPTVAPGGKWIAYMSLRGGGLAVTSYPTPGRRWQIAADGVEPQWLSPTELLYRSGVSWFLARIDPVSGELAAQPTLWGRDMRFSDTPGWSNRSTRDGGIIYVQGPPETSGAFLRVVPGWVAQARAAVAEANK